MISVEVPVDLDGARRSADRGRAEHPGVARPHGYRRGFDAPGLSVTVLQAPWVDLDLLLDFFLDDPHLPGELHEHRPRRTMTSRGPHGPDGDLGGLRRRRHDYTHVGGSSGRPVLHRGDARPSWPMDDDPAILDHIADTLTVTQ